MKRSWVWRVALGVCVAGWLAAHAVAVVSMGDGKAWAVALMNITSSGTVVLALWGRTTHPDDAWENGRAIGDAAGYARAFAEFDRHPRSGGMRVVR